MQNDLFAHDGSAGVYVTNGWYLALSKKSTAKRQVLIFDVPGSPSTYHCGCKSFWVIDGIDRCVVYSDGDPSRTPSAEVVNRASRLLLELTDEGKLFPESLASVIYSNAWEKGAECAFNNEPKSNNIYQQGTIEYGAWVDGWEGC